MVKRNGAGDSVTLDGAPFIATAIDDDPYVRFRQVRTWIIVGSKVTPPGRAPPGPTMVSRIWPPAPKTKAPPGVKADGAGQVVFGGHAAATCAPTSARVQ